MELLFLLGLGSMGFLAIDAAAERSRKERERQQSLDEIRRTIERMRVDIRKY